MWHVWQHKIIEAKWGYMAPTAKIEVAERVYPPVYSNAKVEREVAGHQPAEKSEL